MVNDEQRSSDVLAWPNIYYVELSQTATIGKEDDVKDVNAANIGMKMNK